MMRCVCGAIVNGGRGGGYHKNSASAWRVAMAPRQLLLELEEVDSAAEKGPKRVRADSTNEGSTQQADCYIAARKDVHRHARGSSRGRLAGIQSPSPSPTLLTHSNNLAIYTSTLLPGVRAVAPY
eukprot:scaffold10960_cov115-Isochrysis_galbana.AAC.3